MRIVVFSPAAQTAFKRYQDEVPGFDEACDALVSTLTEDPEKGWNTAGGYHEYLLAPAAKPRVRLTYTFDDKEILIRDIEAHLPDAGR